MSLASRGALLISLVVAVAAVPLAAARWFRTAAEQRLATDSATALLAAFLDVQFKLGGAHWTTVPVPPAASGQAPVALEAWTQPVTALSARIRWAAACRPDGGCIEFMRRFAIPRESILQQVDPGATTATLRPLALPTLPDNNLLVLTLPIPDGNGVLAAVLEQGDSALVAARIERLAMYASPSAALILGLLGFRLLIVRPVRVIGSGVGRAETALRDATSADTLPEELAALARRVQETEQELSHWRGEAGALKHSLDRRLEARTADVTRALRRAERAADTDALTQLSNRRVLEREMPALFATQLENGDELSVVWFDIDHFKEFNDARGHQAGDDLIRFAGALIGSAARRQSDLAVRYGGDEFVLVLRGTVMTEAVEITNRLARLFDQHIRTLGDTNPPPALSAGVASLQRSQPLDATDLLRIADEAMYAAKRAGQVVVSADNLKR